MAKLILSPFPPFKLNRPRIPRAGKNCFTAFTRGRPRVPFFIHHQEAVKPLENDVRYIPPLIPQESPFLYAAIQNDRHSSSLASTRSVNRLISDIPRRLDDTAPLLAQDFRRREKPPRSGKDALAASDVRKDADLAAAPTDASSVLTHLSPSLYDALVFTPL
jgi:hypothetical protein